MSKVPYKLSRTSYKLLSNLGMMLVYRPLNGEYYSTWWRAMTISLKTKSKIGFRWSLYALDLSKLVVQGPHYVFLQILPLHFAIVFDCRLLPHFNVFFFCCYCCCLISATSPWIIAIQFWLEPVVAAAFRLLLLLPMFDYIRFWYSSSSTHLISWAWKISTHQLEGECWKGLSFNSRQCTRRFSCNMSLTSSNMLADAFTKPFGKETFSTIICKLGVLDIHSPTIFRKTKLFWIRISLRGRCVRFWIKTLVIILKDYTSRCSLP